MLRTIIRLVTFAAATQALSWNAQAQTDACKEVFSSASFYQYVAIEDALWLQGDPVKASALAAGFLAQDRNCREQAEANRLMELASLQLATPGTDGPDTAFGPGGAGSIHPGPSDTVCAEDLVQPVLLRHRGVTYPSRAAERGMEGRCNVTVDVDIAGLPYNVEASCTDSIFQREAERAVSAMVFSPATACGEPVERPGVVYPLEFELE